MHWLADHLLLWQSPLTHASVVSAHAYYSNTLIVPTPSTVPFARILHTGWIIGAFIVLAKLAKGRRESNWLFDGASLCEYGETIGDVAPSDCPLALSTSAVLYGASILVYLTRILPSLGLLSPAQLPTPPLADPSNPSDPTVLPLRELAASNAVLAAALVGVVILQCGQYYSERLEERERDEEMEARLARRRRRLAESNKAAAAATAVAGVEAGSEAAQGSSSGTSR